MPPESKPSLAANLQILDYGGQKIEELAMQTVYPRYTLAERLVLTVIRVVTWPVDRFSGWVRRKVVVSLAPSADRR